MKPWLSNALTFGGISALVTALMYGLGALTGPTCSASSPLPSLSAISFVVLMLMAGFLTTRAGEAVGDAALAGVVAALISAVGSLLGTAIELTVTNQSQCISGDALAGLGTLLVGSVALVVTVVVALLGLVVGAGLGAIGGVFGRRVTTR